MIIGDRIYLRAFDSKDVALRARWMNDPEVRTYLNNPFPVSESSTESWLARINSDPSRIDLMICLKEDHTPIGYTGYRDIDYINGGAEIYIGIGSKEHWGEGLGTEAKKISINYVFDRYNINVIYAKMRPQNLGSIRLNKKIGFQIDGVLRSHVFSKGAYRDMMIMSLLREEFFELHGE